MTLSGEGLRTKLTLSSLSSAPFGYFLSLNCRLCPRPSLQLLGLSSSLGGEKRDREGNGDETLVKLAPVDVAGESTNGSRGKPFWLTNIVAGAVRGVPVIT